MLVVSNIGLQLTQEANITLEGGGTIRASLPYSPPVHGPSPILPSTLEPSGQTQLDSMGPNRPQPVTYDESFSALIEKHRKIV